METQTIEWGQKFNELVHELRDIRRSNLTMIGLQLIDSEDRMGYLNSNLFQKKESRVEMLDEVLSEVEGDMLEFSEDDNQDIDWKGEFNRLKSRIISVQESDLRQWFYEKAESIEQSS